MAAPNKATKKIISEATKALKQSFNDWLDEFSLLLEEAYREGFEAGTKQGKTYPLKIVQTRREGE